MTNYLYSLFPEIEAQHNAYVQRYMASGLKDHEDNHGLAASEGRKAWEKALGIERREVEVVDLPKTCRWKASPAAMVIINHLREDHGITHELDDVAELAVRHYETSKQNNATFGTPTCFVRTLVVRQGDGWLVKFLDIGEV